MKNLEVVFYVGITFHLLSTHLIQSCKFKFNTARRTTLDE